MSTTVCCTPQVIPTQAPLLQRWWRGAASALEGLRDQWQRHSRDRAERLTLQSLSESTLRDIGLAERLPPQPYTLGVLDHERGRWS